MVLPCLNKFNLIPGDEPYDNFKTVVWKNEVVKVETKINLGVID